MAYEQPPQRPPAPSLFIGPPAQQATAASIQQQPARQTAPAYDNHAGTPIELLNKPLRDAIGAKNAEARQPEGEPTAGKSLLHATNQQASQASQTEAAWAEMQNTLEEVELSAAGGANAFGADHAKALEELRKAQIALAQAWTRSEVDDESVEKAEGPSHGKGSGSEDRGEHAKMSSGSVLQNRRRGQDGEAVGAEGVEKSRPRASTSVSAGVTSLEEETERDINLARRRREANDRYFEKVNRGVVDVVEKLELVAQKLKDVETEAQEIWDDESVDSE